MARITKIEKLSGKKYQSWKYNVKLVLMEHGLWGLALEGKEKPPADCREKLFSMTFRQSVFPYCIERGCSAR